MSKTFVFTPKLGPDGKQVVRRAKTGEFFEDKINGPVLTFFNTANEYPILTLTVIGEELDGVRKVWEKWVNVEDEDKFNRYRGFEEQMWSAISALAKAMKWGER